MSIADTLHDAVNEIDTYFQEDGTSYSDNLDMWIMNVRDSMELLRCRLDTNPVNGRQPTFRIYSDPEPDEHEDA